MTWVDKGHDRDSKAQRGQAVQSMHTYTYTYRNTHTHTHAHSTQAGPKTKSTSSWRGEAWSGI